MAPIRSQQRKKKAQQKVGPSAPLPSLQLQPSPVSSDWWEEFSMRISAGSSTATFESFFTISRKTFNYICALVEDEMSSNSARYTDLSGKLLSLSERVAVALRRLSTGESLAALRELLRVHPSTVSHVTWWFIEAMEKRALHHIRWPSTAGDMTDIKSKFEAILGLPNCCGAIATTNIKFCLSASDPSFNIWCDKENKASMILQTIVDPQMRFLDIFTGLPGGLSDSDVLQSSNFFSLSEEGTRLNGNSLKLSGEVELREYIVGHEGLPLLPWLLTPYRGRRGLAAFKTDYNKRHYETWKVAKCALAKLKENWRIIQGVMWRPDKHRLPRMILVCCLLHNIQIDLEESLQDGINFSDDNGQYNRQPIKHSPSKAASAQRENLALYLTANLPA